MKVLTNEQMKWIDQQTIETYGIPGLLLMERASLAVFDAGMQCMKANDLDQVLIICGPGNNGGDGLAAARHFDAAGVTTVLLLTADPDSLQGDALLNYQMLNNRSIQIFHCLKDLKSCLDSKMNDTLIIDALFGTGLARTVTGTFFKVIEWINAQRCQVLSVDIPSGIHGNTGSVLGQSVCATKTIAFHLPKIGNVTYPGAAFNGQLTVVPIGIPRELDNSSPGAARIVESREIARILPERRPDAHKGSFGTLLIIGGVEGYTGAGILAAKAAQVSGTGLVKTAIRRNLNQIFENNLLEAVTLPLDDDENGISEEGFQKLTDECKTAAAVIAGPGWGRSPDWIPFLKVMMEELKTPLVLDADGLNLTASHMEWLVNRSAPTVITPHPGEMARLTGNSIEEINNNRLETALEAAQKWKVIVVLKGAGTIIACPEGKAVINTTGNAGMAKAGSGDVLAGIIGSLLAQGMDPYDASVAGCWIHGRAGDKGAEEAGQVSLTAGDIIRHLPKTFFELTSMENEIKRS